MSEIVKFRLESGGEVFVEAVGGPETAEEPETELALEYKDVDEAMPARREPTRRGLGKSAQKVAKEASETFEAALESVKPVAQAVIEAVKEFNRPTEIGLEFGIQLKADVNAFVVTGEGTGTFKLSLKWKSDGAGSRGA